MMNVLYIPLDERPCNIDYPLKTVKVSEEVNCVSLDKNLLGHKKTPANKQAVWEFLNRECENMDYAIISTEMLLYGGLLASRLHYLTEADKVYYEQQLRALKSKNPNLKIYLSNLIMRTPKYNSSDEEPDYYEAYGERIFQYGWLMDKGDREGLTSDEAQELQILTSEIPSEVINDYKNRRDYNVSINLLNIQLVEEKIIDFLVIPQDDSAPYGFTAIDQKKVYEEIYCKNMKDEVMVYPGADEVGFTLLARAYNDYKQKQPGVYVKYSSTLGPELVPLYEDRIINESLKAHVMAAGMRLVDDKSQADYFLAYNTPGKTMQESWDQLGKRDVTYDSYRHLLTFVDEIKLAVAEGMIIGVCDSAYSNGGDIELIAMLDKQNLINSLSVYKAWNTNCNSLGSTLCGLSFTDQASNQSQLRNNLYANIFEDVFYQSIIRMNLTTEFLPALGANYFDLKEYQPIVMATVQDKMVELKQQWLTNSLENDLVLFEELSSPWNRMFEINCQIKLMEENKDGK